MPAFKQLSAVAAGYQNPLTPGGPELVVSRFGQTVAVADHVVGVIGQIGTLPAGTRPVDLYIRSDVLGVGFKASVGLANAAGTDFSTDAADGGAAWVVDDTTGVAGGYVQLVPAVFGKVLPKDADRKILVKVTGAGTAAGIFSVDLVYANA